MIQHIIDEYYVAIQSLLATAATIILVYMVIEGITNEEPKPIFCYEDVYCVDKRWVDSCYETFKIADKFNGEAPIYIGLGDSIPCTLD